LKVADGIEFRGGSAADKSATIEFNSYAGTKDDTIDIKVIDSSDNTLKRAISIGRTGSTNTLGGVLHGVWESDGTISTSDRRLKRSIVSLGKSIAEQTADLRGDAAEGVAAKSPPGADRSSTVSWVLRELRPVSFKFKHGSEAKHLRYGFVAQEVQQVLPAIVRGSDDKHLSVVYQDLIALLTLATQTLQDTVKEQDTQLQAQKDKTDEMMKYLKELESRMEQMFSESKPTPPAAKDDQMELMMGYIKVLDTKIDQWTKLPEQEGASQQAVVHL
jgi:hypothetical protein